MVARINTGKQLFPDSQENSVSPNNAQLLRLPGVGCAFYFVKTFGGYGIHRRR